MNTSSTTLAPAIQNVQLVLACRQLSASIEFLTQRLGFKVRMILPSDAPRIAVLSAHGCHLRLEQIDDDTAQVTPQRLRLLCNTALLPTSIPALPHTLQGPDGLLIELVDAVPQLLIPAGTQEYVLTRMLAEGSTQETWGAGRAGMLYRDLIPSRLGGRFVASHIRIPDAGPVPDYVHFHRVRFQMIYCKSGWVRLVYEDQGEPFILQAGDCVLQPPEIRHRVLEASAGLEVIEIGCPAIHETCGDPEMNLPTSAYRPDRFFQHQQFIHHQLAYAKWQPSVLQGFGERDTGIAAATQGLADVRVLRAGAAAHGHEVVAAPSGLQQHDGEFLFFFVLSGNVDLLCIDAQGTQRIDHLHLNDSVVLPTGSAYQWLLRGEVELLQVRMSA
jgi:quercetin dioxygenase-like cupin family protein